MKKIVVIILFYLPFLCNAQIGGTHTYDFLNITHSARVSSLGGEVIAITDDDLNFSVQYYYNKNDHFQVQPRW